VSLEGKCLDQKSLRALTRKPECWNELAKDCISFANAMGGRHGDKTSHNHRAADREDGNS
jgi:ATP-dependent DNA helicase RecG